tara:strand:- start:4304 stop:4585 length:282 start_codon:yes stop_codon:yes gene_type:complete
MSNKISTEHKSDRYIATVTGSQLAEELRKELTWCAKPMISVYLVFNNSIDVEPKDKIYDIYVASEYGSFLDQTRYDYALIKANEILSGSTNKS